MAWNRRAALVAFFCLAKASLAINRDIQMSFEGAYPYGVGGGDCSIYATAQASGVEGGCEEIALLLAMDEKGELHSVFCSVELFASGSYLLHAQGTPVSERIPCRLPLWTGGKYKAVARMYCITSELKTKQPQVMDWVEVEVPKCR